MQEQSSEGRRYWPRGRRDKPISERFWEKVDSSAGPDACWPWMATTQKAYPYGRFGIEGTMHGAHRVAWMLAHGPITGGLWVLHSCDNPPCCNPAHLRLGTKDDNAADMAKRERSRSTKLTAADVRAIRKAASHGVSQYALADQFDVTQANIGYIVNRKTWKHVD